MPLLPATIVGSAPALAGVRTPVMKPQTGLTGGILVVCTIAAMCYAGMAAIPTPAALSGAARAMGGGTVLAGASIALALVLSIAFIDRRLTADRYAVSQNQRYLQTIVANAPVILVALDASGRIVFAEGRDLNALGCPLSDLIGRHFHDCYAHLPEIVDQARRALIGTSPASDVAVGEHVLETRWTTLRDATGATTSVIFVATDITQRRSAELALHHRSLHDPLTGLPNRTCLDMRLSELLAPALPQGEQCALAVIDLDRFKDINDTLGHHVGDDLLRSVAARIDRCLAEQGYANAAVRLGGDEFAVVLAGAGDVQAVRIVQLLLREFETPFEAGDYTLDVGASFGIAVAPLHAHDKQTLFRCADVAMYVAKRGRLGYAVYDDAQDRNSKALWSLEIDMRQAIATGGFVMHYQPQVDLQSGRVCAVEALVRWEHPVHGRLAPDRFIPLAEETGLIVPLTFWVLEETIRQSSMWAAAGLTLNLAINVSMRSLRDATFPDRVAALLRQYDVAADRLVIEVTESVVMADSECTRAVLERLAALGVVLSIDDFGTGYSSIAYLKDLPVGELKIDKSFVFGLAGADSRDAQFIGLIADLGHNLGLRIVAEGVEHFDVLVMLADLGCNIAQGYHISRPMPAADVEPWLYAAGRSAGGFPADPTLEADLVALA